MRQALSLFMYMFRLFISVSLPQAGLFSLGLYLSISGRLCLPLRLFLSTGLSLFYLFSASFSLYLTPALSLSFSSRRDPPPRPSIHPPVHAHGQATLLGRCHALPARGLGASVEALVRHLLHELLQRLGLDLLLQLVGQRGASFAMGRGRLHRVRGHGVDTKRS